MEDHPGDIFGRRVSAFWGAVAAILAFGVVLTVVRKMSAPAEESVADAGAAEYRKEKLMLTQREQDEEFDKRVVEKDVARVSPADAIPYAAKVLSTQKQSKSAIGVPGAAPVVPSGVHDPALSKFEGK